ncbi:MAG: hypothetical protein ABIR30_10285 [Chitinophagaceae bacterium]
MKKFLLLITAVSMLTASFATASTSRPPLKASEIFVPVGKTGAKISLLELSELSVKQLELLTDRKLSLFDKVNFRIAQKKLRDNIDRDGTINTKKLEKVMSRKGGETGFHLGGFALGFFLGVIGVLIAYLLNDDYKRNRVKWSWIGFGIALILNIILIIAVFNNVNDY